MLFLAAGLLPLTAACLVYRDSVLSSCMYIIMPSLPL